MKTSARRPVLVESGAAMKALEPGAPCGDRSLVVEYPGGVLAAVIDGIGHGREAAAAAAAAAAALRRDPERPLASLVRRCHEELVRTRGVVMSLAAFDGERRTLAWLGVGNVQTVLLRGNPHLRPPLDYAVLHAGVVGYDLPALHESVLPLAAGDTLLFATDGVAEGFAEGLSPRLAPRLMAERVLAERGRGTDDALVLAVRFLGRAR